MSQNPAPEELLVLVNCHCQTGCSSGHCSCMRSGIPCTDACTCIDCTNCSARNTSDVNDDESDVEESDNEDF